MDESEKEDFIANLYVDLTNIVRSKARGDGEITFRKYEFEWSIEYSGDPREGDLCFDDPDSDSDASHVAQFRRADDDIIYLQNTALHGIADDGFEIAFDDQNHALAVGVSDDAENEFIRRMINEGVRA